MIYSTNSFPEDTVAQGENPYSDMKGAILNISVVVRDFQQYESHAIIEPSGEVKLYPCLSYELLALLQIGMNFTPNLKPTDHWGFYDREKSAWRGMIGHLLHNITDLALGGSVDMPERRAVVDFNLHYNSWQLLALYRTPDFNHDKFASLRPFSPLMWLAMGGLNMALIFALLFVSTTHHRHGIFNAGGSNSFSRQICHTLDCIFWPGKILCCKGIHPLPEADSIRFVVFIGCFAAMVLNVAYSGTLISFVMVASSGFTRFEQLLETSFVFDTRPNTTLHIIQASASPSVMEAVRRINKKMAYREVFEAREKLLEGSFVFIAHNLAAYDALNDNFNPQDRCLINDLILPMQSPKCGTMVRKKSPLKRIIDYQIVKAKQFGLNNCWHKRYIPRRQFCLTGTGPGDGIPLRSVVVSICILISGVIASSVTLMVEIILNFYEKT